MLAILLAPFSKKYVKGSFYNMTTHTIISSENQETITNFLSENLSEDTIQISAKGTSIAHILAQLSAKIISSANDTKKLSISIENLDYGSFSTKQLKTIIGQITETLNNLNSNLIENVYWSGTRMTLVQLVMDYMTHEVMQKNRAFNQAELQNISTTGGEINQYEIITK